MRDRLTGEMEIVVPESLRDYVIEDIQFGEVIGQGTKWQYDRGGQVGRIHCRCQRDALDS